MLGWEAPQGRAVRGGGGMRPAEWGTPRGESMGARRVGSHVRLSVGRRGGLRGKDVPEGRRGRLACAVAVASCWEASRVGRVWPGGRRERLAGAVAVANCWRASRVGHAQAPRGAVARRGPSRAALGQREVGAFTVGAGGRRAGVRPWWHEDRRRGRRSTGRSQKCAADRGRCCPHGGSGIAVRRLHCGWSASDLGEKGDEAHEQRHVAWGPSRRRGGSTPGARRQSSGAGGAHAGGAGSTARRGS